MGVLGCTRWLLLSLVLLAAAVYGHNPHTCFRCSMGESNAKCLVNTILCHSEERLMMCVTRVKYFEDGSIDWIERGCEDGTDRKESLVDVHDCKGALTCEHVCATDYCNHVVPPKPKELGAVCFYCDGENTNMACNDLGEDGMPSSEHARYCPSTKDAMACRSTVTYDDSDVLVSVSKGCYDGDKCEPGLVTCDADSCSQCCDGESSMLCNLESIKSMRQEYKDMAKRCYFCKNAEEASECGQWIGCKNNEICYTKEIAMTFTKKNIMKGCVAKGKEIKYNEPICSNDQNECISYCDGDLCNTHSFNVRFMKKARTFKNSENMKHARGRGEVGSCRAFGSCHFRSFDGRWLHFQGSCNYLMVQDNCRRGMSWSTPSFRVFADLHRGEYESQEVGFIKRIIIVDGNDTYTLEQNRVVYINGVLQYGTPITRGNIVITNFADNLYLTRKHSLQIKWDGKTTVEVSVPFSYMTQLCGLCGNFNDDPEDDWVIGMGCPVSNENHPGHQTSVGAIFGSSWWSADDEDHGCANTCDHVEPDERMETCINSDPVRGVCDLWFRDSDQQGPFRESMEEVSDNDKAHFSVSCRYDVCVTDLEVRIKCEHLRFTASFSLSEFGVKSVGWRDEYSSDCDSIFPENGCTDEEQSYKACMDVTVQKYCSAYDSQILDGCDEGCFCHNHTYWNGVHCVAQTKCGCVYDTYTVPFDTKITLPGCSQVCHCKPDASELSCRPVSCAGGAECMLQEDGAFGCRCPAGLWSPDPYRKDCGDPPGKPSSADACMCDLQGHPAFKTYDNQFVNIIGTGEFLLAAHPIDKSHDCDFYITVTVELQDAHNPTGDTFILNVIYRHGNVTIVMSQDKDGIAMDGVFRRFNGGPLSVSSKGRSISIHPKDDGIELRADKCRTQVIRWNPDAENSDLVVIASHSAYAPLLRGMCGNCDGDDKNDFMTAEGDNVIGNPHRSELLSESFKWKHYKTLEKRSH